jgi:hypothetical protein
VVLSTPTLLAILARISKSFRILCAYSNIQCPGSHSTNHIALGGIRPNSFPNISCVMTFRSRISKMKRLVSVSVSELSESKSDNESQRQTASCHLIPPVRWVCRQENYDTPPECASVGCVLSRFNTRRISEIRRGNEEIRNEGRPGRLYRHETDAVIRPILQENPNA